MENMSAQAHNRGEVVAFTINLALRLGLNETTLKNMTLSWVRVLHNVNGIPLFAA